MVVLAAAAVVTNLIKGNFVTKHRLTKLVALISLTFGLFSNAAAGVLPDDRADVLYHSYDGGGVTIDGPSVLVRKKFLNNFSVTGNYYVDSVTSASIDVITTASAYTEERTQTSLNFEALYGNTTFSWGYAQSEENDYSAESFSFGISQDVFDGLTTISMGYSLGDDLVSQNGNEEFGEKDVDRQSYRLGLSQVITKNMLLGMSFEVITDEGFLNNPYRSVRFLEADTFQYQAEQYPNTRTSSAGSLRTRYYMPWRAAVHGEYRFFSDTWGIAAHTGQIGYTHPTDFGWDFDFHIRYYTQDQADFYSDLFIRRDQQNFLARDKEMSTFTSSSIRLGGTYTLFENGWSFFDKGTLNVFYDRMQFDYDNFRDLSVYIDLDPSVVITPGTEPLYGFSANVIQFFVSVWF